MRVDSSSLVGTLFLVPSLVLGAQSSGRPSEAVEAALYEFMDARAPGECGGDLRRPYFYPAPLLAPEVTEGLGADYALMNFWKSAIQRGETKLVPTNEERHAILFAMLNEPSLPRFPPMVAMRLPEMLGLLPRDRASLNELRSAYDRWAEEGSVSEGQLGKIRHWLMMNSDHFREELVAAALSAEDRGSSVVHHEELRRLAEIDWVVAKPILENKANTSTRTGVLVWAVLHRHHLKGGEDQEAEAARANLFKVAERGSTLVDPAGNDTSGVSTTEASAPKGSTLRDRVAKSRLRALAISALLEDAWDGWEEWYLDRFRDASVRAVERDGNVMRSLLLPVERDPETWIPRFVGMIEDENLVVAGNAMQVLVLASGDGHRGRDLRPEAIQPLIPFLNRIPWPSWNERSAFLHAVATLGLKEAIPFFLQQLEQVHISQKYSLESVAELLADLGVKQAGRRVLALSEGTPDELISQPLLRSMVKLGSFDDEELGDAFVFLLHQLAADGEEASSHDYHDDWEDEKWPLLLRLGAVVAEGREVPPPEIVDRILASTFDAEFEAALDPGGDSDLEAVLPPGTFPSRGDLPGKELSGEDQSVEQQSRKSLFSKHREKILTRWSTPSIDQFLVAETGRRVPSVYVLRHLLYRRGERALSLGEGVGTRSIGTGLREGLMHGFLAVLVQDVQLQERILASDLDTDRGSDPIAQAALLAAARYCGDKLEIATVTRLARRPEPLLRRAATSYLHSSELPEASSALWSLYPDQGYIAGPRLDAASKRFSPFAGEEASLREEVTAPNGPDEIFAVLGSDHKGSLGRSIVVRVNHQSAHRAQVQCGLGQSRLVENGQIEPSLSKPGGVRDGTVRDSEEKYGEASVPLSPKTYRQLTEFLSRYNVDRLPTLVTMAEHGRQYEYLHLQRRGGKRVLMYAPSWHEGSVHDVLLQVFTSLCP